MEEADLATPEASFACRKGCGFCCTYPPKVSEDRLAEIEAQAGDTPTARDEHGNLRLPLQGGCGGCVLLEDRVCQAHGHRPDHCRFFPFHVYFGRTVEVIADRVCPGIDVGDDHQGPHQPARQAQAWEPTRDIDEAALDQLDGADPDELARRAERARQAHDRLRGEARWDDRWRDPDEAIQAVLDHAEVTQPAWEAALAPFRAEDPAQLPTTVIPNDNGFEWRAWRIDDELTRLVFTEGGPMRIVDTQPAPHPPAGRELGPEVRDVLTELAELEAFVGTVLYLVDEEELSVDEAAKRRVDDVAAGLALHARLLEAEDLPVTPAWLRAVYEPEFYTLGTLGTWL